MRLIRSGMFAYGEEGSLIQILFQWKSVSSFLKLLQWINNIRNTIFFQMLSEWTRPKTDLRRSAFGSGLFLWHALLGFRSTNFGWIRCDLTRIWWTRAHSTSKPLCTKTNARVDVGKENFLTPMFFRTFLYQGLTDTCTVMSTEILILGGSGFLGEAKIAVSWFLV